MKQWLLDIQYLSGETSLWLDCFSCIYKETQICINMRTLIIRKTRLHRVEYFTADLIHERLRLKLVD